MCEHGGGCRCWWVHIDPRPRALLCGDESGTLGHGGPFFVVATVRLRDRRIARRMVTLKQALRQRTGGKRIGEEFSCKSDTYPTRQEVFRLVAEEAVEIEASVVDKRLLPQELIERPVDLFGLLWFDHLCHALPGALAPCTWLTVMLAEFDSPMRRELFKRAYGYAAAVAWAPFATHQQELERDPLMAPYRFPQRMTEIPYVRYTTRPAAKERVLQAADYAAWAVRRWLEQGDDEGMVFLSEKISSIRLVRFAKWSDARPHGGLRSNRVNDPNFGEWQAWFEYLKGPLSSHQADVAIEGAKKENDPAAALKYFPAIRFDQHLPARRAVLHSYLVYLHEFLPERDRLAVEHLLIQAIASLVGTTYQPGFDVLMTALSLLSNRGPEGSLSVDEAAAGALIATAAHLNEPNRPDLLSACSAFAYEEAKARSRGGDISGARGIYARVIGVAEGSTQPKVRALGLRAKVNLMANIDGGWRYREKVLTSVIEASHNETDDIFGEVYCMASLNVARARLADGDVGLARTLIERAIVRATTTNEGWCNGFVEEARATLGPGA